MGIVSARIEMRVGVAKGAGGVSVRDKGSAVCVEVGSSEGEAGLSSGEDGVARV